MRYSAVGIAVTIVLGAARASSAQVITIPLTPAEWIATDTIKFGEHLGQSAVYINSGVAMSRSAHFHNGTLEFDIAAPPRASNLGIAFHAQRSDMFETLFFRPGASGTDLALQYAPAVNSVAAAWQIWHGEGANVAVQVPRDKWIHVKLMVAGDSAWVFLDRAATPVLTIPRLGLGGTGADVGLWGGGFGRGAWYANMTYTVDNSTYQHVTELLPRGTIADWQLSEMFDAPAVTPGKLPDLAKLKWQTVTLEPAGFVLVNRYRRSPSIVPPSNLDSMMHNQVAGSKVVFARTFIDSDRARTQLLHFGYSDNIVIYCNGQPIFSGINAMNVRDNGYFYPLGDAVFLPLRKGRNEIVYAVTDFFGGWAFSGRLAP